MVLLPAEYQANDLTMLLYLRYINLSLQIDETRQKAVDMMTDVRDITAKQTPAYDPAALNTAASVGQVQVVKQLLELPEVDMNFRDPQYNYETALHGACRNGHFDIVKLLVAQKASVDIVDEYGQTPFHEALRANDLNLVEFMGQNGADMNKVSGAGHTSLHFAARGNNVPILKFLLDSPLNIHSLSEQDEDGSTPLLYAAKAGSVDTVQFLLQKLSSNEILRKTKNGRTCLHCAIKSQSPKMVSMFRNSGISYLSKTEEGFTALHYAVESRDPVLLRTFLDQIDDTTLVAPNPFENETITSKPPFFQNSHGAWAIDGFPNPRGLDMPSQSGETALQLLISSENFFLPLFEDLVSRVGIDLEFRDKQMKTPLVALASRLAIKADYDMSEAIEVLLDLGVDVNSQDLSGCTALHYLCRAEVSMGGPALAYAIETLIDKRRLARVDIYDNDEETSLQAFFGNMNGVHTQNVMTRIALRLLEMSPKDHVKQRLPDGNLLLNLAVVSKNNTIITKLLEFNVSTEDRDGTSDFRSPLELFCIHGTTSTEILRQFILQCKDTSELDTDGMSLLHLASDNGHLNIVQQLLGTGIDVNILSRKRLTALALAATKGHTKIVELLLDHNSTIGSGTTWYLLGRIPSLTIYTLLDDKGVIDWKETSSLVFPTNFVPKFSTRKPAKIRGKWVSIVVDNLAPLHLLANSGHVNVLRHFFEHVPNINVNLEASHGLTALFFAVLAENQEKVEFLLSVGAQVDAVFPQKWTSLHLSAFLGNAEIVEVLLSHGADPSALDHSFLTPSNLALQQQHAKLSNILKTAEQSLGKLDSLLPL
jgi:ankyrin repeat protein